MNVSENILIDKIFGKPIQAGAFTLIEKCPICAERFTFRFLGTKDLWECAACHNNGSWQDLTEIMANNRKMLAVMEGREPTSVPEGLILLSEWSNDTDETRYMSGFECVDKMMGGFATSLLTVVTGKRGEGKSTYASQWAVNTVEQGIPVFFYSGELSVFLFRRWMMNQIAGNKYLEPYEDESGATRYRASYQTEDKILKWLGNRMILYDNSVAKSSGRNVILERMEKAYIRFGCGMYFLDNLMTAKYATDNNQNYYRAQSNFVGELCDFAQQKNVHVVLVAHPRKSAIGEEEDLNENVAGASEITNMASNVIRVIKNSDEKAEKDGCNCVIQVTKNRVHGITGKHKFNFDNASKRFEPLNGKYTMDYGWETFAP